MHGSIWKFSSDCTEGLVCICKKFFANFTNRGGVNKSWVKQVMGRLLLASECMGMGINEDPYFYLSYYEKKKHKDMQKFMY